MVNLKYVPKSDTFETTRNQKYLVFTYQIANTNYIDE